MCAHAICYCLYLRFTANISRIDANFVCSIFNGQNRKRRRKMNICHDRQRRGIFDHFYCARIRLITNGYTHNLTPCFIKSRNLRKCRFGFRRVGCCH